MQIGIFGAPFPVVIDGTKGEALDGERWRVRGEVRPIPEWARGRIARARRLGAARWEGTSPR